MAVYDYMHCVFMGHVQGGKHLTMLAKPKQYKTENGVEHDSQQLHMIIYYLLCYLATHRELGLEVAEGHVIQDGSSKVV